MSRRSDQPEFRPAARLSLLALAGLEPPWTLAGRAAFWWAPGVPSPIAQLDLVWREDGLGERPREVLQVLSAAGFDAALLHGNARRTWLVARTPEDSACLLRLTAEPAPPVEPPWRATLFGLPVALEDRREVLVLALAALWARPDVQDIEDAALLLRNGQPLDRALEDLRRREPGFSPQPLAWRLARLDLADVDGAEGEETGGAVGRSSVSRARQCRARERLVCELLARSDAPESRAS